MTGCVIEHVESDGAKNVWDTKWHIGVVNYAHTEPSNAAQFETWAAGCGVIYASHHVHMTQERLTTCIMRLAAITGTMQLARFSAARLRPAVLFKDVCSPGHPMTSNMRCFFHFHICDICVYTILYTLGWHHVECTE